MHFYIHIPFCKQRCSYCKFAITPVFDAAKKRRYLAHLTQEIKKYFELSLLIHPKKTLYFGGGTPSVLSLDEVKIILDVFPAIHPEDEFTFEMNPEDVEPDYIQRLLDMGVNRFSLGVQSLDPQVLVTVQRSSPETIYYALGIFESLKKKYPFSLNVDFIIGLPYSSYGYTLQGIQKLHEEYKSITHTSVYLLEDGKYPLSWQDTQVSSELMEREYGEICHYFSKKGWQHYEISNWALPGYECRHNQGYWLHHSYRGFGLSATSFERASGERSTHALSFSGYYRGEVSHTEVLEDRQWKLETIICELRTFSLKNEGFSQDVINELTEKQWITLENGKILLTPTGIFRENTILSKLVENMPP